MYIEIYRVKLTLNHPRLHSGLDKYVMIMDTLHNCDVSKDREFQRLYNGFYRMRQRPSGFYQVYYEFMEDHKTMTQLDFADVLLYLYTATSRIEPSFSSKLLATVQPNMPVWDSVVLAQLSIKQPQDYYNNPADRLKKRVDIYNGLVSRYSEYLNTQNAADVIGAFNEIHPGAQITDVKKIDLALWSLGLNQNLVLENH